MQNKKVAIVGTMGIPAQYGGFETLAEHLTREKGSEFDFEVYCSAQAYPEKKHRHNQARLIYIPLKANGTQSVLYDIWSLLKAVEKNDVLLVLGVSGCVLLPLLKVFSKTKIIVNIDGMEWKRDKWGKIAKWFLKFSETCAVKYADVVVADNEIIQEHVWKSYRKHAELIAYGADQCKREKITATTRSAFPFLTEKYAFKVCRIEPENNIQPILEVFKEFKSLNLVIVGNWKHSNYSRKLEKQYKDCENIFLLPPIYDQKKLNQLRSNCYLYVHGHSAGGTNPSLVEAMFLQLPIVAFDVGYNRKTTHNQALFFHDKKMLSKILRNLNDTKLQTLGHRLFAVAKTHYTWKRIASQYGEICAQICETVSKPAPALPLLFFQKLKK